MAFLPHTEYDFRLNLEVICYYEVGGGFVI